MDDALHRNGAAGRPSALLLALESRAPWELCSLPLALPLLSRLPRGDGHAVLVIPGLLASDASTIPMRILLRHLGYDVHGWGLGRNRGPRNGVNQGLRDKLSALRRRSGRRVSLVGWSLGGIFARELARANPGDARLVVSLGSPLYGHPASATNAWLAYRLASGSSEVGPDDWGGAPPPVPTTSIYSRSDGIVHWRSSVERVGPRSENIVVESSHVGMGWNAAALYALADRLGQEEGEWAPFRPVGAARWMYASAQPERRRREAKTREA